jgi:flagellar FliJ protein
MKSRDTAFRLKRFEASERVRKVCDLEQMIREFELITTDLERQIQAEEDRTGVRDPGHFAYSTFAKSAADRRENLMASIENLRLQYEAAVRARDEVLEDLERTDQPDPRDHMRGRRRPEREAKVEMR